jgi:hypothetical protein
MVGVGITLPVLPFYIKSLSKADGICSQNLLLHVGPMIGVYPFMQFLFPLIPGRYPKGMEEGDRIERKYALRQVTMVSYKPVWHLYSASNSAIQMRYDKASQLLMKNKYSLDLHQFFRLKVFLHLPKIKYRSIVASFIIH